ncbi:hypothetical protein O6H91_23G031600 [Diphasiastrum complanatum]|uniref:Uncharacterized protein n=1 Tax=Diphasiastrum complanatum TaxID=34168 RepID=A0ACC2A9H9_DIPCM|nr:hypothetical protein O6H91_23G031600 [Diphasiastrum complanatum]
MAAEIGLGMLLDIVDDQWLRETLPDDDIPFPPGVAPPTEDMDETNQDQQPGTQDKWNELGLHTIR